MSSSARAVFLGRPPGIFLLMKWITCSLSGAVPTVAGGALVCLRGHQLEHVVGQALRLEAHVPPSRCASA
jgi:hypothetical protein